MSLVVQLTASVVSHDIVKFITFLATLYRVILLFNRLNIFFFFYNVFS